MTAVQSLPNLSLSRLGWSSSGSGHQNTLGTDDINRLGTGRKEFQHSDSISSDSLNSFSTTNPPVKGDSTAVLPQKNSSSGAGAGSRLVRGFWSAAKIEPQQQPALAQGLDIRAPSEPPSQPKIMQNPSQPSNGVKMGQQPSTQETPALLVLVPMNATFERKQINVPLFPEMLRIGRQTNVKTVPTSTNGYFDSKVLSRQHAEVWADRSGKIWIRDVKSSNGTFVNGVRLSPESRDSEPHELRENDMLELGIDIVSEDQKSIVHHKVSAKIEHAGIPINTASVLDLNMADIEPGSGGGLSLPNNNMMRRLSNSSAASSSSRSGAYQINGTQANGFGVQKHAGAWIRPISIEQVVKRLTVSLYLEWRVLLILVQSEMRQAKEQSQDLNRTGEFVQALLNVKPGQDFPKAPVDLFQSPPVFNGVSPHREHVSPFSQPPAPPPQLPLPEKPDVPPSLSPDRPTSGSPKRSETDRFMPINGKIDPASSQILQLVDALSSAKKEIDNQDIRVRQLEEQLRQERRARESAEERMRTFLENLHKPRSDADETASVASEITVIAENQEEVDSEESRDSKYVTTSATRLQERLDSLLREMGELRDQMEVYKRRAEKAEEEKSSLADMVEQIRTKDAQADKRSPSLQRVKSKDSGLWTSANGALTKQTNGSGKHDQAMNGSADTSTPRQKRLQDLATAAMSIQRDGKFAQSAPYASIIGVVLIGVGIMAYLNSWQKLEAS